MGLRRSRPWTAFRVWNGWDAAFLRFWVTSCKQLSPDPALEPMTLECCGILNVNLTPPHERVNVYRIGGRSGSFETYGEGEFYPWKGKIEISDDLISWAMTESPNEISERTIVFFRKTGRVIEIIKAPVPKVSTYDGSCKSVAKPSEIPRMF